MRTVEKATHFLDVHGQVLRGLGACRTAAGRRYFAAPAKNVMSSSPCSTLAAAR